MIETRHRFRLEFCVPWNYVPRAVGLADEILSGWAPVVAELELVPASGGRFELTLDGELVFSKKALGRHAEPGEIAGLVRERLGPEVMEG